MAFRREGEKCKVLLVDDHEGLRQELRDLLTKHGDIDVIGEVGDGAQAIKFLSSCEPHVVVLDLNMPILNGTQTLFELKQHSRFNKIPVIIYSTSDNDHEKRKCLNFGAVEYLVKPISVDEGDRMVKKFLQFI